MIIRDELGARTAVSIEVIDRPGALDATVEALARNLIKTGEGVGAFIRPESIWTTRVRSHREPFDEIVTAIWAPDPTEGVILHGGPLDGADVPLRREDGGKPLQRLRLPTAADTDMGRTAVADYERAGIDSERDRWVYEFVSMG